MAKVASNLHVVMFPWLAFGHLIAFYELAVVLAKQGVRVSYVSTPKNIERLPKIGPHLATLMQYVALPLPVVPVGSLRQGAEATIDLEYDEIQYLKVAYDLLCDRVKDFVSSNSPDWIISDFCAHWLPEIAQECHVPLMFFSIFTVTFLAFIGPPEYLTGEGQKRVRATSDSLTTPPKWGRGIFPPTVAYQRNEAAEFHSAFYNVNASGISDFGRFSKIIQGCQAVGIRGCWEFEGEYFDLYQNIIHKPVVPIGVLPATKSEEREYIGDPWSATFQWLDQQMARSVVFVGFGSETKLTKDVVELAQLPFIWALRRPNWATDDSEILPPQFVTRTSTKGIVCFGWAPQLKILAHPSVGGSLFHCGAASIVETLQHGLNLILLPCLGDQGLNARVLVEKGLGVEVERREDGSYTGDDIADALRRAMVGNEAEEIRARTKQVALVFGDQKLHQERYIGGLIEFLRNGTRQQ